MQSPPASTTKKIQRQPYTEAKDYQLNEEQLSHEEDEIEDVSGNDLDEDVPVDGDMSEDASGGEQDEPPQKKSKNGSKINQLSKTVACQRSKHCSKPDRHPGACNRNRADNSDHQSFWQAINDHNKQVGELLPRAKKNELRPEQFEPMLMIYNTVCKVYQKTAERKSMLMKQRQAFEAKPWHFVVEKVSKEILTQGFEYIEEQLQVYEENPVDDNIIQNEYDDFIVDIVMPEHLEADLMHLKEWDSIRDMCCALGHIVSNSVYKEERFMPGINRVFVSSHKCLKEFCEKILQDK
jgi:hypothetical protein